jgi:hypothetical protein
MVFSNLALTLLRTAHLLAVRDQRNRHHLVLLALNLLASESSLPFSESRISLASLVAKRRSHPGFSYAFTPIAKPGLLDELHIIRACIRSGMVLR